MNVKPYELASIRNKRAWQSIADQLGLHITIVKEAYFNRWFTGVQARDFIDLVKRNEITWEDVVEGGDDFMEMPLSELDRREAEADKYARENDDSDMLNYQLKKLIQVGDYVVSDETKTFCFSKKQYQTQGKKYRIIGLDDKRESLTGFSAQTTSDLRGERIWWSVYSVRSLWRNRKEIWNWNLAYLEQFKQLNPNHPQTQEMIDHCTKGAEKIRKGERD